MTSESPQSREPVIVITTEHGDDLIIGYGIPHGEPGNVVSLILQRSPKYEHIFDREERGVLVSHELFPTSDRERLRSIFLRGPRVDVETTVRTYYLDLSDAEPEDVADAEAVLLEMHRFGGFDLRRG